MESSHLVSRLRPVLKQRDQIMTTIYLPMRRFGGNKERVLIQWCGMFLFLIFGKVVLGGDGLDPSSASEKLLCVAASISAGAAILTLGGICEQIRRLAMPHTTADRTVAVLWLLWHLAAFIILACGFVQMAAPAWAIGTGLYCSEI